MMKHLNPYIKVLWKKQKKICFKDCIVLDVIERHNIKIFDCYYNDNRYHKEMDITSNLYRLNLLFQKDKSNSYKTNSGSC